jgi:hypothetical protein
MRKKPTPANNRDTVFNDSLLMVFPYNFGSQSCRDTSSLLRRLPGMRTLPTLAGPTTDACQRPGGWS